MKDARKLGMQDSIRGEANRRAKELGWVARTERPEQTLARLKRERAELDERIA